MLYDKIPKEYHGILRLDIRNPKPNTSKPDGLSIIESVVEVVDLSKKSDYEKKIILENLKYNRL